MCVTDPVWAEESVVPANMSENFDAVETMARRRHDDICQVNAKKLDFAWRPPEFGANEN